MAKHASFSKRGAVKKRSSKADPVTATEEGPSPKIGMHANDNRQPLGTQNKNFKGMTEPGQDGEANNYPAERKSKQNRRGPTDNHSVSVKTTGKGRAGV